jgi:hypothetical protein
VALLLKRIMRFAAMRTIRTVFNPDFALLGKGPLRPHDLFRKPVSHVSGSCSQGETSRRLNREWRAYNNVWGILQSADRF